MAQATTQQIFKFVDQTTEQLQKILNVSYRDALSENIFNILAQKTYQEDGYPTQEQAQKLNESYQKFNLKTYSITDIKRALEFAIVKAQKVDQLDVNLLMTPDVIGTLCALVIAEIFRDNSQSHLEVMDPTIGTGNLLIETALELKKSTTLNLSLHGIDNDDSLLTIAAALSQAVNEKIDLYHQDAVADWIISDYDLVLADLPVGYYPMDDNTLDFQTRAQKGHSYAHHLIIEQAMKNVRPGGIGIFIVPAQIFQTNQAKTLAHWLVSSVYLQAVLSLPQTLFASEAATKSLIVLQRHGQTSQQTPQVLMGEIPDLGNTSDIIKFKNQLQNWSQKTFKWEK
ncbi:class I SAM-dependent methyltransferase [Bombilactobacillus bombi]|uniref:class I SAM-dependent methyltransferase n=1 Tax=Bombilactobacillus bombi TaxID=1303590 RepID=UPI0015E5ED24|nr:class I SAM-dependent methyltransferase [Bombilactobacillus bombi]MBA1434858.1 class I SAM-dependent methyltransferase [Bombilactobacillus bombi]